MPKFEITLRWYYTGLGDKPEGPAGEPKTIVIDTEVDRKYDGASTGKEVKETFLQSITQDPLHNVMLKVESVKQIA